MAVMHHHQFTIRTLRNEMIRQTLQTRRELEAELVHAGEEVEMLHWIGHIGQDKVRHPALGETFGTP